MSSRVPASATCSVSSMSSGEGVGSPLGWLWTSTIAAQFWRIASRKSSPARPQDDGEKLGVGERPGAGVLQPLTRPNRLGEVLQPDAVFGQPWRGDLSTPLAGRAPLEIAASIAPPSGHTGHPERSSGLR